MPDRRPIRTLPALALLLGAMGTACWNGSFQDNAVYGQAGAGRFTLLIETDRSDVEATHFLLDSQTGDLWRLATSGATPGEWTPVADGPSDARPIEEIAIPQAPPDE